MGTATEKKEDSKASTDAKETTKEVKEEKKDPATLTLEDVREHCRLLERSVVSKESRFAVRVMRGLPATRKKLTSGILKKIITGFYTHSASERETLLGYIPDDVSFRFKATESTLYALKFTKFLLTFLALRTEIGLFVDLIARHYDFSLYMNYLQYYD